jgi:putative phage-type endonuclease
MRGYGKAEEILSREKVDAHDEEWYRLRREGITATDIGALTGNSLYGKTAFTVYWTKVADLRTAPDAQMKAGLDWQETALQMAYKHGGDFYEGLWEGLAKPGLLRNSQRPWMLCSPDALVYVKGDGWVPLEIKTSARWNASDGSPLFGTEGTDEMPRDYWCQSAWQAMVVGARYGYVAVLMPNHRVKIYRVNWDSDWDWMKAEAYRFLENHLYPEEPPELSGTTAELQVMKRVQQLDPESVIDLDEEMLALAAEMRHLRATIRDYEQLKDKCEARIREKMGKAKTATDQYGNPVFVRRVVKRKGYTVDDTEYEVLDVKKPRKVEEL